MKIKEILETINKELSKMDSEKEYVFSLSSKWNKGKYINFEFFVCEEKCEPFGGKR